MEKSCVMCRKPDSASSCGLCSGSLCRKCRIDLGDAAFPFMPEVSPDLKHAFYCGACFDERVAPAQAEYEATLEQAKGVTVLFKGSKSTVRTLRKSDKSLKVEGSKDRDDTILLLAFQATQAGFNSLIDVEVSSKKVRNEGWQHSLWQGTGLPADVKTYEHERLS